MKNTPTLMNLTASLVLCGMLAACSTTKGIEETRQVVDTAKTRVATATSELQSRKDLEVPIYQRVNELWVSDRVLPKNSSQRLPDVFNKKFVLREQNPLAMSDVADIVRSTTNISVTLNGDAISAQRAPIDSTTSLKSLLDSSTSKYGMTWVWQDNQIMINQSVVRTFVIDRPGLDPVKSLTAAPTAQGGATLVLKDPWTEIMEAIRVVAPKARISSSRNSNTVTVADTPASVARVAEFLELDDRQASKKVTLLWKLVVFSSKTGAEAGVGLNYLLGRGSGKLSFSTPGSLTSAVGSAIKLDALADTTDALMGTNIIMNLLNEAGSAITIQDGISEVKQNGRADFGTEKEVFYIAKSTPGVVSSSTTAAQVGLEQASVKFGFTGAFGATVYDSERVDLSFDFAVAALDQLKSFATSGTTLQSPETTKRYAKGMAQVKHGETWILSATATDINSFDRRGILPGSAAVVGGSEITSSNRDQWMLIVTPILTKKGI